MAKRSQRYRQFVDACRANLRARLPALSADDLEYVVEMIGRAYTAGEWNEFADQLNKESDEARQRSRKGVEARRRKSKRQAIADAFKAAAAGRGDVSIEQLAKEYGVSRSTAYRALSAAPTRKPRR